MNKDSKSKLEIMVASLLAITPGVANTTPVQQQKHCQESKKMFTPIEELSPELRAQIFEKIRIISTMIKIDWENIIVGIDENDEVVLRAKSETDLQVLGNPTCWKSE